MEIFQNLKLKLQEKEQLKEINNMLKMNKKGMIYQLNSLLSKINDYKDNPKLIPEFTIGERYALIEAIDFINDEKNDTENIYKIKQDYEKKLKEEIQEHCDHVWGEDHWTWSCGGYHKCTKCGKIEEFYERD